ncbi:MAG TPA: hypothetical protein VIG75_03035 [Citricoccus sp.]
MSTSELIAWAGLAVGFAGAFGIFATGRLPRRIGSMAMGTGLAVFVLSALQTLLWPSLSGSPALPFVWIPAVVATVLGARWMTRYFYRDLDLYAAEGRYSTESE